MKKNWLSIVAVVISLIAVGQVVSGPKTAVEKQTTSVMERVRETGVLRCGYFIEPPYAMLDNSGKVTGIIPDVMQAIAKYAEIKVEFTTEIALASMIEDLNLGKYDMICGSAGYNPIRSKRALFTTPFIYAPLYAVVRPDETRIAPDLSNLETSGALVAALDGEVGTLTARVRFPNAKFLALSQMSGFDIQLQDVVSKRSDITFVSPQVFTSFDDNNPGKLKVLSYVNPIAMYPVGFMIRQGEHDFERFVSDSLRFLDATGTLDAIYDKYDPKHALFLRLSKTYHVGEQVK